MPPLNRLDSAGTKSWASRLLATSSLADSEFDGAERSARRNVDSSDESIEDNRANKSFPNNVSSICSCAGPQLGEQLPPLSAACCNRANASASGSPRLLAASTTSTSKLKVK